MIKFKSLCAVALLSLASACHCYAPLAQPDMPINVHGWDGYDRDGIRVAGEFVLRVGDSTDNGTIGVTVKSIKPGEACADPNQYLGSSKVVLVFFRPSDRQVLCEYESLSGGNGRLPSECVNKVPKISTVVVYEINTELNWVHFELLE